MRFFSALSILGLAAAAAAAPSPSKVSTELQEPADTANDGWDVSSNDTWVTATKRDDKWSKGNTNLYFSKERINWGNIPPWWVADKLHEKCDSSGCDAEYESGTTIVDSNISIRRIDFTVDTGPTDYEVWVKRGLIQLMSKAMQVKDMYEIKRHQPYMRPCNGFACQNTKTKYYDQYIGPRRIKVEYQNPKGLRMSTLQIDVRNEADSGQQCMNNAKIASALAGVVSSFGGLFGLAELFC